MKEPDEQKPKATAVPDLVPESAEPPKAPGQGKKRVLPPDLVSQTEPEDTEADSGPPEPDQEESDPDKDDTPFDDEKTSEAINEIVAKEGDDVLAAQDAAAGKFEAKPKVKSGKSGGFWRKKWVRWLLFFIVFGGLLGVMAVPSTRYWTLNTAGVRSAASVVAIDSTTELPLKGVGVTIAGKTVETDKEGRASFKNMKLGPTRLQISQVGFQEIDRKVVIGWGSNPFGTFSLKATGVRFVIEVRDYLSDKPLKGVEATDGEGSALSDKNGKITLTLGSSVVAKDGITLSKAGYRSEDITLNENPKQTTKAKLVPARKAFYVSKQSGKYDLYKSDIDGKNREVLLPGTGHENSNISLAVSPDGNRVAFVSTRDNKKDSGGALKSTLVLVNTLNGADVTIAEASQIQLIDWIGNRIVFQLSSTDGSAANRYTVVSYDYATNKRLQLAAAKQLNTVISAQGYIYYAPAADTSNPSLQLGLFKIRADGNKKQRLVEDEVTTLLRSAYNTLSLQTEDGNWYSVDIPAATKTDIDTPGSLASRLYVDNASRTLSLWIDQGTLKGYDVAGSQAVDDIETQSGLTYPITWISDTAAIYRVSNGTETADYAVSTEGGTAHRIAQVSPTYGFAQAQ